NPPPGLPEIFPVSLQVARSERVLVDTIARQLERAAPAYLVEMHRQWYRFLGTWKHKLMSEVQERLLFVPRRDSLRQGAAKRKQATQVAGRVVAAAKRRDLPLLRRRHRRTEVGCDQ